MHSMISVLPPVIGISRTFWQTLESCTENFFGVWKLSLSMILRIFLIFGDLSLDDSYKLNSYRKKSVYYSQIYYNEPSDDTSMDISFQQNGMQNWMKMIMKAPNKPKNSYGAKFTKMTIGWGAISFFQIQAWVCDCVNSVIW